MANSKEESNTKRLLTGTLTAIFLVIALSAYVTPVYAGITGSITSVYYQDVILIDEQTGHGTGGGAPYPVPLEHDVIIRVEFSVGVAVGDKIWIRIIGPPGATIHTISHTFTAAEAGATSITRTYPNDFLKIYDATPTPNPNGDTDEGEAHSASTQNFGKYTIYVSVDGSTYQQWGWFWALSWVKGAISYDAIRTTFETTDVILTIPASQAVGFGPDTVHFGVNLYKGAPPGSAFAMSHVVVDITAAGVRSFIAGGAGWYDPATGASMPLPSPLDADKYYLHDIKNFWVYTPSDGTGKNTPDSGSLGTPDPAKNTDGFGPGKVKLLTDRTGQAESGATHAGCGIHPNAYYFYAFDTMATLDFDAIRTEWEKIKITLPDVLADEPAHVKVVVSDGTNTYVQYFEIKHGENYLYFGFTAKNVPVAGWTPDIPSTGLPVAGKYTVDVWQWRVDLPNNWAGPEPPGPYASWTGYVPPHCVANGGPVHDPSELLTTPPYFYVFSDVAVALSHDAVKCGQYVTVTVTVTPAVAGGDTVHLVVEATHDGNTWPIEFTISGASVATSTLYPVDLGTDGGGTISCDTTMSRNGIFSFKLTADAEPAPVNDYARAKQPLGSEPVLLNSLTDVTFWYYIDSTSDSIPGIQATWPIYVRSGDTVTNGYFSPYVVLYLDTNNDGTVDARLISQVWAEDNTGATDGWIQWKMSDASQVYTEALWHDGFVTDPGLPGPVPGGWGPLSWWQTNAGSPYLNAHVLYVAFAVGYWASPDANSYTQVDFADELILTTGSGSKTYLDEPLGKYVVDVRQWSAAGVPRVYGSSVANTPLKYFYLFKSLRITLRTGDAYLDTTHSPSPAQVPIVDVDTRPIPMAPNDHVTVAWSTITPNLNNPSGTLTLTATTTGAGTYGWGVLPMDGVPPWEDKDFNAPCKTTLDITETAGSLSRFLQDPDGYWVKNDYHLVTGSPTSSEDKFLEGAGGISSYWVFKKAYSLGLVYWFHFASVSVNQWLDGTTAAYLITNNKHLTILISEDGCEMLQGESAWLVAHLGFMNDKYPTLPTDYYAVFSLSGPAAPPNVKKTLTFPTDFSLIDGTSVASPPPSGRYSLTWVANTAHEQNPTWFLSQGDVWFYIVSEIRVEAKAKYIAKKDAETMVADQPVTTSTTITVTLYCITLKASDHIYLDVTVHDPTWTDAYTLKFDFHVTSDTEDPHVSHVFPDDWPGPPAGQPDAYGQWDITISNGAQDLKTYRHPHGCDGGVCYSYNSAPEAWELADPSSHVYPYFEVVNVDTDLPVYDYWDGAGQLGSKTVKVEASGFKDSLDYPLWILVYGLDSPSVPLVVKGPYTQSDFPVSITRTWDYPGTYFVKVSEAEKTDCPAIPKWPDLKVGSDEDWALGAFFGIWGEDKRAYGVGETITTRGGGAAPSDTNPGDTITIEIQRGAWTSGALTTTADEYGQWEITWQIPWKLTTMAGHGGWIKVMYGSGDGQYTFDYSVTKNSDPTGKYKDQHDLSIVDLDTYDRNGPHTWPTSALQDIFQRSQDANPNGPFTSGENVVYIHWNSFWDDPSNMLTVQILYNPSDGTWHPIPLTPDTVPATDDYYSWEVPTDAHQVTYEVLVTGLSDVPNVGKYQVTATCHFGVWGNDEQTKTSWGDYYRTETLLVQGGGAFPGSPGSTVHVTIKDDVQNIVRWHGDVTADLHGNWQTTPEWKIPADLSPVDATYQIDVKYDKTYDSNDHYTDPGWIQTPEDFCKTDIDKAQLDVTVTTDNKIYQVGMPIVIHADVKYPSGTVMDNSFPRASVKAKIVSETLIASLNLVWSGSDWYSDTPYTVQATDPSNTPWKIIVSADDGNHNIGQSDTVVTVSNKLVVTVTADLGGYQRSETIHVTAKIAYEKSTVPAPSGKLGWIIRSGSTQTIATSSGYPALNVPYSGGAYTFDYPIKVGDPIGTYTITVDAQDSGGYNTGTGSTAVAVDESTLNVVVTTDYSSYTRFSTITIRADITYSGGQDMADTAGQVVAHIYLLNGNDIATVPLSYSGSGSHWSGTYYINKDDQTGTWYVEVLAHDSATPPKPNAGSGKSDNITIDPLSSTLAVTTDKSSYNRFETIQISYAPIYPDATKMNSGSVVAHIGTVDTVGLHFDNNVAMWVGTYKITWDFPSGSLTITCYAEDAYMAPNTWSGTKQVTINIATLAVTANPDASAVTRTLSITITSAITYADGTVMDSIRLGSYGYVTATLSGAWSYGPVPMTWSNNFWTVTITVPYDAGVGAEDVAINAADKASDPNTGSKTLTGAFTINPATLQIVKATDKLEYVRGQTMIVSATVTYPDGTTTLTSGTVQASVCQGSSCKASPYTMTYASGKWSTTPILWAHNDPSGTWTVTVTANDGVSPTSNMGTDPLNVLLDPEPLNVAITSPAPDAIWNKGDIVSITACVTYASDSSSVTSGTVTFTKPDGTTASMTHGSGCTWSASYIISGSENVDTWTIRASASDSAVNPNTGYAQVVNQIGTPYTVTYLYTPTGTTPTYGSVMNRGEVVWIDVQVTDVHGALVSGATVTANSPTGGSIAGFSEYATGKYKMQYTILSSDPLGTWTITTTATKNGNTDSADTVVKISSAYTVTYIYTGTDATPSYGSNVIRGQSIWINVNVADVHGSLVHEATVTANGPTGGTITSFTEYATGKYKMQYTILSSDPLGTWTITATATKNGNSGSGQTTMTVSPGTTGVTGYYDVSGAWPGATVALKADVQNGGAAAFPSGMQLWFYVINPAGTGTWVGYADVSGQPAGTRTYAYSWTLPTAIGSYSYEANLWLYSGGSYTKISDFLEPAKVFSVEYVILTLYHDLPDAHPGEPATLAVDVLNPSSAPLPSNSEVWFWVDGPGWLGSHWIGPRNIGGLDPGATQTYSFDWPIPSSARTGVYTYWAQAWYSGPYRPASDWLLPGKTFTVSYTIQLTSYYDVSGAHPGATVTLSVDVKNTGLSVLPSNAEVWFYVDGPGWTGSHWVDFVSIAGLTPGATQTYSISWTVPSSASVGTYTYWAQAWYSGPWRPASDWLLPGKTFTVS